MYAPPAKQRREALSQICQTGVNYKDQILPRNKHIIAREYLILVVSAVVGFGMGFVLRPHRDDEVLVVLLGPYIGLQFFRSLVWAIKAYFTK